MIKIINEKNDILQYIENDEYIICHQCNCISVYALGLAKKIFSILNSDIYSTERKFGSIVIEKNVVHMFCQYYPGKPQPPNDSEEKRLEMFNLCLSNIIDFFPNKKILIPYKIGCGLAKGNWENYGYPYASSQRQSRRRFGE